MLRVKNYFLSCLCLFLGTTAQTFADPGKAPDRDPHKWADKAVEKLTKELNLSADQAAKVRAVFEDGADQMKEMRQDHPPGEEMHGQYMKQMTAEKMDTAAMNRQFAERMSRMQERHAIMQRHFVELHDALTPDQRAKLAKFMEKRREEMKDGWERRRGNDKKDKDDGDEK